MSKPSLAPFIRARPWLRRWVQPIADWYVNSCGYRQVGLLSDDLIPEESDTVQKALKRLPPKEAYDRVFRLRRAFQLSLQHTILPKEEWTTTAQDRPYLSQLIEDIERENKERQELDAMVPNKK
ncbi:14 kDa subunit of cytochrome bd ubiquinol oxidase [Viridothelium virens]|uniref:Cytochrome b-c1 complex subunit 7 n=1 Tax=Viridothelium virens TaxID=1048519 RepID=A0A6A6HAV1_VIRVR|nr:14 kDa subunit of cytochrome bd ubiquinol oxidase [Viridothelium virens]